MPWRRLFPVDSTFNEAKDKLDQIAAHFETIPHHVYVRHGVVWKNLAEIMEGMPGV